MHSCSLVAAALALGAASSAVAAPSSRLTLVPGEREPAGARSVDDAELARLRDAVAAKPGDRGARFALVRALDRSGKLAEAIEAARAWRAVDAYNLVVVRLLGDLYAAKGERAQARRTYSAVVELLPKDAGAQRALASALKQAGDLQAAYERLTAATELAPADRRLGFELADAAYRIDRLGEARERFEAIVADGATPEAVDYPARQRLAQIYHQQARAAAAVGNTAEATRLEASIAALELKGGSENDIKIYLTWDTDRSDVDLWVTNPAGEKVFYEHRNGRFGDALYDDITTGYGPESYTAPKAAPGTYLVQVNYYGVGRGNLSEARGEVVIVLDEGKPTETRQVLPYRLFEAKDTVTVARIDVRAGASR